MVYYSKFDIEGVYLMNITVFCGASMGSEPVFERSAFKMGEWIASRKNILVYGGGKAGLMGVVSEATLKFGGEVIGVIPEFLKNRELANTNITHLKVVESMSERKQEMARLGDAFIALPGGPGTLEEITEMISWARIGQNPNPCIFFNTSGFYNPVRNSYDSMVETGFLTHEDREKILFSDSFAEINAFISNYSAPKIRKY